MEDEILPEEGEENVYSDKTREDLVDNDELSPQEEAFMKGYDEETSKESKEKEDKSEEANEEEL